MRPVDKMPYGIILWGGNTWFNTRTFELGISNRSRDGRYDMFMDNSDTNVRTVYDISAPPSNISRIIYSLAHNNFATSPGLSSRSIFKRKHQIQFNCSCLHYLKEYFYLRSSPSFCQMASIILIICSVNMSCRKSKGRKGRCINYV